MNILPIEVYIPSGVNNDDDNSELKYNFDYFISLFFSNVVD